MRCGAKVTAAVTRVGVASCFSGGVTLSVNASGAPPNATAPPPSVPTAFLRWDADEEEAAAAVSTIVPGAVSVQRSGDGHGEVRFSITYWALGDFPPLSVDSGLLATNGSFTVDVEEVVPGGLDLQPLPGRYLTLPATVPSVSVRLGASSTGAPRNRVKPLVGWSAHRSAAFAPHARVRALLTLPQLLTRAVPLCNIPLCSVTFL